MNNFVRTMVAGLVLLQLSHSSINAAAKCGPQAKSYLRGVVNGYFGRSHDAACEKAITILIMHRPQSINNNLEACFDDNIEESARKGALDAIEEEAQRRAYAITNDRIMANKIAAMIKEEAASEVHPSGGGVTVGCLSEFVGSSLDNKIRNHANNSPKAIENKIRQYAERYFNANQYSDTRLIGNVNAIINEAKEKLSRNSSEQDIRNAVLDASIKHLSATAGNYAKNKYRDTDIAAAVKAKIEQQLNNRINGNSLRHRDLNNSPLGTFGTYYGNELEKDIDAIVKDLRR